MKKWPWPPGHQSGLTKSWSRHAFQKERPYGGFDPMRLQKIKEELLRDWGFWKKKPIGEIAKSFGAPAKEIAFILDQL